MHIRDEDLTTTLSEQLDGAEKLAAATFARVPTAVGFTRMLTPLGNYFIARPAARSAANKLTEETGVPLDAAVVLGLSEQALHVWAADPMLNQVHDHLGHVPLEHITAMEATPGRSWNKFVMTVQGEHAVELEARGPVHELVAAFDARRS